MESHTCLADGAIQVIMRKNNNVCDRISGFYIRSDGWWGLASRFPSPDWVYKSQSSESHIARYQHGVFSGWALYFCELNNGYNEDGPPGPMEPIFIVEGEDAPAATGWRHNDIQPQLARARELAEGVPCLSFFYSDRVAGEKILARHDERLARQVFRQRLSSGDLDNTKGWFCGDSDEDLFVSCGRPWAPRRSTLVHRLRMGLSTALEFFNPSGRFSGAGILMAAIILWSRPSHSS